MRRAAAKSLGKKTTRTVSTKHTPSGRFVDEEYVVLRRGGKAVGVVISIDELRYFQELENRLDVRQADKALADPRRTPYEEVRRKLGL